MQTFLKISFYKTLRRRVAEHSNFLAKKYACFGKRLFLKTVPAFTLVELMVVLGIFAVITSVVVYRYRDFNNNIILTNTAYEIGLLVRQAQVYGLSVRGSGASDAFNQGYGVFINKSDNSFVLCADTDGTILGSEKNGDRICNINSGADTKIDSLQMPAQYTIAGLQTKKSGFDEEDVENLSIVFVRPNPNAYIVGGGQNLSANYIEARIIVASPSGNQKTVVITHTGQISVE